jgi:hypothetical protein
MERELVDRLSQKINPAEGPGGMAGSMLKSRGYSRPQAALQPAAHAEGPRGPVWATGKLYTSPRPG